jgi:hypothetical protein
MCSLVFEDISERNFSGDIKTVNNYFLWALNNKNIMLPWKCRHWIDFGKCRAESNIGFISGNVRQSQTLNSGMSARVQHWIDFRLYRADSNIGFISGNVGQSPALDLFLGMSGRVQYWIYLRECRAESNIGFICGNVGQSPTLDLFPGMSGRVRQRK